MKKKKIKNFYELYKSIRKNWNGVNPVTKVEKDKKKYTRKEKHRGQSDAFLFRRTTSNYTY